MKGSKCKCGFSTLSYRRACPRCGRQMTSGDWPDEGRVLSFARLQAVPEGLQDPYDMALVEIEDGPKLVCWSSCILKEKDEVSISKVEGKYICTPKVTPDQKPNSTSKTD
ncbi:MAG: hypothetical protein JW880_07830 [Candidatus Thermoplasmatota archaeon]|nr:hypothetical protein [Candidatus Thermoplasmatota archaeon]